MEHTAYKRLHLAWISSNKGTTMIEPFVSGLPLLLMVFFVGSYWRYFVKNMFLFEFIALFVPITLNLTACSNCVHVIPSILGLFMLIICLFNRRFNFMKLKQAFELPVEKNAWWITNFRACTSIATIICIFAVDLNIFPPKFAKTESYGFSVMDGGVGFYIICHGLVQKTKQYSDEFRGIFNLIAIGCIRLMSIKIIGYQEHTTEYGIHWNFFFTLAACRLVSILLRQLFYGINTAVVTITIGALHHKILFSGAQDWVLGTSPRLTVWDSNREGLVSLLGYVTLFYAAVSYKKYIAVGSTGTTFLKTVVLSICLWLALGTEHMDVSRRLCNIGYITWVCAMATSIAAVLMFVDILLENMGCSRVPTLLYAINKKGLLFFLIGNIFTGTLNIIFQTLLLSTGQSYCLLLFYVFSVTFITWKIYKYSEK